MEQVIIYQVFTRLYGNRNTTRQENGTIEENGCGKMADFSSEVLKDIAQTGVSHIWYTGIIRHATTTDYTTYGIPRQHSAVVKGKAGSPYAIADYYDVDPDLAVDVNQRMQEFEQLVERFITKFPQAADGYIYRARTHVDKGEFAAAEEDMRQALKVSDAPDNTHYQYAQLIYQKVVYQTDKPYESWTLERALQESQEAYHIKPEPVYRLQQAQLLYAMQKYADAYAIYEELQQGPLRNAENFYAAAQCKIQLDDKKAALALLDSALVTFSKPYVKTADNTPVSLTDDLIRSGDTNDDGILDAVDYILVKKIVLGNASASISKMYVADANSDRVVDAVDYLLIKKCVLGTAQTSEKPRYWRAPFTSKPGTHIPDDPTSDVESSDNSSESSALSATPVWAM